MPPIAAGSIDANDDSGSGPNGAPPMPRSPSVGSGSGSLGVNSPGSTDSPGATGGAGELPGGWPGAGGAVGGSVWLGSPRSRAYRLDKAAIALDSSSAFSVPDFNTSPIA